MDQRQNSQVKQNLMNCGTRTGHAQHKPQEREQWGSKIEFILAVAGHIVGLGNVWRFPYLCYKNGGGVFFIPYVLFLFTCGIPLFFLETSLGQYTSQGGITCWRKICPLFEGLGYGSQVVVFYTGVYYIIILAWTFLYLFSSFSSELPWATCHNSWNTNGCFEHGHNQTSSLHLYGNSTSSVVEFWERRILGLSSGIEKIGNIRWDLALCLLLAWMLCYFCVWNGVKSTGKVVYFTATFPYVMLVVLLVRGLTLPGAKNGIMFYLYPDPSRLTDPENMLRRHEDVENGTAWSNSSESSDDSSSPRLSVGGLRNSTHHKSVVVTPDIQPAVSGSSSPQPDISFCPRDSSSSTPNSTHKVSTNREVAITSGHQAQSDREEEKGSVTVMTRPDREEEDAGKRSSTTADGAATNSHASRSYSRSLSHISENSADGIVLADRSAESGEVMSLASGLSINDIEMELPSRTPEPPSCAASDADMSPTRLAVFGENTTPDDVTDQHSKQQDRSSTVLSPSPPWTEAVGSKTPSQMNTHPPPECNTCPESGDVTYVARRVSVEEDTAGAGADCPSREGEGLVDSGLEDALAAVISSLDDYRGQFPELQLLEQELKLLQVTLKGGRHSRSPSMVSLTVETALGSFDFLNTSDWEEEEEEKGDKRSRSGRSLQDRGWDSPTSPLTTGCTTLDLSLVVHLQNCSTQLLCLGMFGPLRCGEMYALDRLLREARVLDIIRRIAKDNPNRLRQPAEVIPQLGLCLGAVSLWQQCVGQGSVYSVSAESFLVMLSTVYSGILPERASNMTDTVFLSLVERVLDQKLPRRGGSRDGVMVTLFQLWSYLEANSIIDMETLITELAEEVWLVQSLASCDQDVIVHALRRPAECSLRREGLHAVAKLLKDPRGKVSASASSVLRSLAAQTQQREQALVSCLELLEDEDVDTRVCGCKALACLKAKESIDQLVYLCRTDKDEVRDAAKQALLVLGEEGKMAYRHVETSQDSIPRLFAPGSMASTAF